MFKTVLSALLLISFSTAKAKETLFQSHSTSVVVFSDVHNTSLNEPANEDIPEELTVPEVTSPEKDLEDITSCNTAKITTYAFFLGIPTFMLINLHNSGSKTDIAVKKKAIKNSVLDADELVASKKLKKKDKINAYRALQIFSIVD